MANYTNLTIRIIYKDNHDVLTEDHTLQLQFPLQVIPP